MARIAVIGGAGYVGLTYAAALAELGHDVVGLDVDATKVEALRDGRSPIFEPGLDVLLQRGLAEGRLRFTTEYAAAVPSADFAFICVGTPSDADGRADMQYVATAARQIGAHGCGHTIVVNKSTLPVGSAHFVGEILTEHAHAGATFTVVSNPEFLREGSALHDVFHPDRIVLGASDEADARRVAALYGPLGAEILVTDPRSAEMIKYASNAFLASKISFINEVALICERFGADVSVVADGMGLDERIGRRFLNAGAGFGGSCFPKDVKALASMARDAGLEPTMLAAVLGTNDAMRSHVVARVEERLGCLAGKTIAVLGLAFKPDTDDIREAPALAVLRKLVAAGARVQATDPVAMPHVAGQVPEVSLMADAYAAATGADAVILMTEWAEYRTMDLDHLANAMRGRLLVDARNALAPSAALEAGFDYVGIGRVGGTATPPLVKDVLVKDVLIEAPSMANAPVAVMAAD
jgi:UDPglucose 6-dehydrogenase